METESIIQANSSKFGAGVDFSALPEDCIAGILARTSIRDACRMSTVSPEFLSAAESDALWETFLPADYREIIGRSSESSARQDFSSKKELFFRLCNSPLLIDGGKKVNTRSNIFLPFFSFVLQNNRNFLNFLFAFIHIIRVINPFFFFFVSNENLDWWVRTSKNMVLVNETYFISNPIINHTHNLPSTSYDDKISTKIWVLLDHERF